MKRSAILLVTILCGCTSARPLMFKISDSDLKNIRTRVSQGLRPFGANHIISHYSQRLHIPLSVYREKLRLAADAGIQLSRVDIPFGPVSPAHVKRFQEIADLHNQVGIEIVVQIGVPTEWSSRISELYADVCRESARNYKYRYWLIGNEPDNTNVSPEDYANMVRVASTALKSVRPDIRIVAPQLGHGKVMPSFEFLRRFHADAAPYYDVLSIHPYSKGRNYVNKALKIVTNKEVWITEDGDQRNPSRAIRGAYAEYLRIPRITKIFWYAFGDLETRMKDWNMLDVQWEQKSTGQIPHYSPRKAYHTYKELAGSISGSAFADAVRNQ